MTRRRRAGRLGPVDVGALRDALEREAERPEVAPLLALGQAILPSLAGAVRLVDERLADLVDEAIAETVRQVVDEAERATRSPAKKKKRAERTRGARTFTREESSSAPTL